MARTLDDILQQIDALLAQEKGEKVFELRQEIASGSLSSKLQIILGADEWATVDELAACYFLDIEGHTLLRKAGRGSFGVVYKAVENDTAKLRAVKVEDRISGDQAYYLFGREGLRENEALPDAFRHEGIVKYYRSGRTLEERRYHIFEWIEGKTLDAVGIIAPEYFAEYMLQLYSAVKHIHSHGYLHNDIRGANIMVDAPSTLPRLTLIDYSIATLYRKGKAVKGANISSREISAPESFAKQELSLQTDIWSIGVLMYKLLAGEHPFPHEDKEFLRAIVTNPDSYNSLERRIKQKIPKKYRKIVQRCLRYEPFERYSAIDGLLDDFHALERKSTAVKQGIFSAGIAALAFGTAALYINYRAEHPISERKEQISEEERREPAWRWPRISEGEDKYEECMSFTNQRKKENCMDFRDAEELIDKKENERAGLILEGLIAKDSRQPAYYGALLQVYFELGRVPEAAELLAEITKRFPEAHIREAGILEPEIRAAAKNNPGFLDFTEKQCDMPFLEEKYPECQALVAAEEIADETVRIQAYEKIVKKHPQSYHTRRKLGQLLLRQGEKKEHPGGVIVYENINAMNAGLAQYAAVATQTRNRVAAFQDIADIFRTFYHDDALVYIYSYRAYQEKEGEPDNQTIADFLAVARSDLRAETASWTEDGKIRTVDLQNFRCSSEPCYEATMESEYALVASACTDMKEFHARNCPNWQGFDGYTLPTLPAK